MSTQYSNHLLKVGEKNFTNSHDKSVIFHISARHDLQTGRILHKTILLSVNVNLPRNI